MEELTLKLLFMSLHGAVLILAAALLRRMLLRALPKGILRLIWAPVFLVLLLPLPELLTFSVPVPEVLRNAPLQEEAERTPWLDAFEAGNAAEPEAYAGRDGDAESAAAANTAGRRLPLLSLIWLTGAGAGGIFLLYLYLAEYARLRRAVPLQGEEIQNWLREHPLRRRLTLRVLPGLHGPLTYGVLRPVILLPEIPDLEDPGTRIALEHEFVHVRHLDTAWKLLMNLTLAIHWFDPAVWLMSGLFDRDMELSCDEAVLLRIGGKRREDFARMLLNNVKRRSLDPFPGMAAGVMRERVYHIMSFRRGSVPRRCLAFLLVLLLSAGAVSSLRAGAADERLYQNGGVVLSLPEAVADLLLVEVPELTGEREEVLFRVYELETVEAAKQLYPDTDTNYGLLLSIMRMDEGTAGKSLKHSLTTRSMLARDEAGYYYMMNRGSAEKSMLTAPETTDMDARWERRKLVSNWVRELREHIRWNVPVRTQYPAYSFVVSSWFARVLYGNGRGYHISCGEDGPYSLYESEERTDFAARLTWEAVSQSSHDYAIPQGEPIIMTDPARDRAMCFWAGSDVAILYSDVGALDSVRYYYRIRLLDSPEEKVGDLMNAWLEATKAASAA